MTADQLIKKRAAAVADIARLQAERADVMRAPQSRAETAEHWRRSFAAAAAGRARVVSHGLAQRGEALPPLAVPASSTGQPIDLAPMLALLFGPDQLVDMLAPYLATLPEGIADADRVQRLAVLDAEILAAEHREQDAIDALEALGVRVAYRADATPAVVLRLTAP